MRQLTSGGQNAEAYFSADDKQLIFQHQGGDVPCDQIYTIPVDVPADTIPTPKLVSTGKGRTTCSYFYPAGDRILFSSTHDASADCPPKPDYSKGYVWPVYSSYDIYTAKPDGSDLRRLTNAPGYDAEATISRDGKKIVFTSMRNGDLDIYTMDADGKNVRQLTHELGYDGGPFWSYDGKKIVYRAEHPKTPEEIADYKKLLAEGKIRPGNLEIWVMDADGGNKRQITHNGAANFAPFFTPDGKRIIFASNMADKSNGRDFDLYIVNVDGSGLERVTYAPDFDSFPMFTSDGKRLVWASNRNGKQPHETNIFIADWSEDGQPVPPRISLDVGNKIRDVTPIYPPMALVAHIQGDVELRAKIDKEGNVEVLRILSGHPLLVQSAIDAVKQWKYRPYLLDGQPVEVDTVLTIHFRRK